MVMPRYQRAGVRIAGMPEISTAALQASSRASESMSQNLNRLSNFAFRQAELEAEQKGREYGALNAPTSQQLEDAIAAGQDPSEIVPGDQRTAFGRAARNTALSSMAVQFETEARQEITRLQAGFENEEISFQELESGLVSVVEQNTNVLQQVSPLAAQKFSAATSVVSNSAYLNAAKKQAQREKDQYEIQLRSEVANFGQYAETIVAAGPTVSEDGTIIDIDDRVGMLRSELLGITQEIGDPTLAQFALENFDNDVRQAKIDVVMDYSLRNSSEAMSAMIAREQFKDPEVQAVYDSMDLQTQNEVFNSVNSALENADARRRREEQYNEEQITKRATSLQAEIQNAMLNNNNDQAEELLEELQEVDLAAYNSSYEAYRSTPGFDDAAAIRELTVMKITGQLTHEAVNTAYSNGQLSAESFNRFSNNLQSQGNAQEQAANEFIRNELDIPNAPAWSYTDAQRKRLRLVNQIENKLYVARQNALAKGEDFNSLAFVETEVEKIQDELNATSGVNVDEATDIYNAILLDNDDIQSPTDAKNRLQSEDLLPDLNPNLRAAYIQYMEALEEERRKQGDM